MDSHFKHTVLKLADSRIRDLERNLGNGAAVDFATYRHEVGRIKELKRLSELFAEAEELLNPKVKA